jgi:hypothetical protein
MLLFFVFDLRLGKSLSLFIFIDVRYKQIIQDVEG